MLNKAQMLALLADNTSGDISAENMRDIITGVVTLLDEWIQARDKLLLADKTGAEPEWALGQLFYSEGKLKIDTAFDGTTLNVGEEEHLEVYNNSGVTIRKGEAVGYGGTASGYPVARPAIANTFATGKCMGVANMNIANGTTGLITTKGLLEGLDLSAFADGAGLYVSSTDAGELVDSFPDIVTQVGFVLSNDAVDGALFVKTANHLALPTVLAYMNEGNITGDIEATFKDIINYQTHGNVVMDYDAAVGTMTMLTSGIYTMTANIGAGFDVVGNNEEKFVLRLNGSIEGNKDISIAVPRNSGAASAYPALSFHAVAGEVVKLQIGGASTTLTNTQLSLMTFEISSKHIR